MLCPNWMVYYSRIAVSVIAHQSLSTKTMLSMHVDECVDDTGMTQKRNLQTLPLLREPWRELGLKLGVAAGVGQPANGAPLGVYPHRASKSSLQHFMLVLDQQTGASRSPAEVCWHCEQAVCSEHGRNLYSYRGNMANGSMQRPSQHSHPSRPTV
jgi:hypothetical protein